MRPVDLFCEPCAGVELPVVQHPRLRVGLILVLKLTVCPTNVPRQVVPRRVDPVNGEVSATVWRWPDVLEERSKSFEVPLCLRPTALYTQCEGSKFLRGRCANHVQIAGVSAGASSARVERCERTACHLLRQEVTRGDGEELMSLALCTAYCPLRPVCDQLAELRPVRPKARRSSPYWSRTCFRVSGSVVSGSPT